MIIPTQEEMQALSNLKDKVFDHIKVCHARGDYGKEYDGTFRIEYQSFQEAFQDEPEINLHLSLYLFGPSRGCDWSAKTLGECVKNAETDIDKWIKEDIEMNQEDYKPKSDNIEIEDEIGVISVPKTQDQLVHEVARLATKYVNILAIDTSPQVEFELKLPNTITNDTDYYIVEIKYSIYYVPRHNRWSAKSIEGLLTMIQNSIDDHQNAMANSIKNSVVPFDYRGGYPKLK